MEKRKIYINEAQLEALKKAQLMEIATRDAFIKFYADKISPEDFEKIASLDKTNPQNMTPLKKWLLDTSLKEGVDAVLSLESSCEELFKFPQHQKNAFAEKLKNGEIQNTFGFKQEINNLIGHGMNQSVSQKNSQNAIVLFSNNTWTVLIPLSYEASHQYGGGSSWCTASSEYGNESGRKYFRQYTVNTAYETNYAYLVMFLNADRTKSYQAAIDNGFCDSFLDWYDEEPGITLEDLCEKISPGLYDKLCDDNFGRMVFKKIKANEAKHDNMLKDIKTQILNNYATQYPDLEITNVESIGPSTYTIETNKGSAVVRDCKLISDFFYKIYYIINSHVIMVKRFEQTGFSLYDINNPGNDLSGPFIYVSPFNNKHVACACISRGSSSSYVQDYALIDDKGNVFAQENLRNISDINTIPRHNCFKFKKNNISYIIDSEGNLVFSAKSIFFDENEQPDLFFASNGDASSELEMYSFKDFQKVVDFSPYYNWCVNDGDVEMLDNGNCIINFTSQDVAFLINRKKQVISPLCYEISIPYKGCPVGIGNSPWCIIDLKTGELPFYNKECTRIYSIRSSRSDAQNLYQGHCYFRVRFGEEDSEYERWFVIDETGKRTTRDFQSFRGFRDNLLCCKRNGKNVIVNYMTGEEWEEGTPGFSERSHLFSIFLHENKKDMSAQAQVGGKVNSGIMDAVVGLNESENTIDVWYRGYNSRHNNFGIPNGCGMWITDEAGYAKSYAEKFGAYGKIAEVTIDWSKIAYASAGDIYDTGLDAWTSYPISKLTLLTQEGYNAWLCGYDNSCEGLYLFDSSAIVSIRVLSQEEYDNIETILDEERASKTALENWYFSTTKDDKPYTWLYRTANNVGSSRSKTGKITLNYLKLKPADEDTLSKCVKNINNGPTDEEVKELKKKGFDSYHCRSNSDGTEKICFFGSKSVFSVQPLCEEKHRKSDLTDLMFDSDDEDVLDICEKIPYAKSKNGKYMDGVLRIIFYDNLPKHKFSDLNKILKKFHDSSKIYDKFIDNNFNDLSFDELSKFFNVTPWMPETCGNIEKFRELKNGYTITNINEESELSEFGFDEKPKCLENMNFRTAYLVMNDEKYMKAQDIQDNEWNKDKHDYMEEAENNNVSKNRTLKSGLIPYDDYGLSMFVVTVSEHDYNVYSRYDIETGYNDEFLDKKEISALLGKPFEKLFPYVKAEKCQEGAEPESDKYFIGFEGNSNNEYGHVLEEELVYQHGATPHKELADFKPNVQPIIAYKQFKLKLDKDGNNLTPGYVYPLYVNTSDSNGETPNGLEIGKWYKAGEGECWLDTRNNRLYTKGKGYGVDKNTLDRLSYRPGWHLTSTPWGNQRGDNKVINGKPGTGNNFLNTKNNEIWAEVEICIDVDATERAKAMSDTPADQCLGKLNDREFYRYKTNSNASDDQTWYIVDTIRIVKVLDDDSVDSINDNFFDNLSKNNPDKKINSDPYNYVKSQTNDIPYWKMPRTNGKRFSKDDLNNMNYKDAGYTKLNESKNDNKYEKEMLSIAKFMEDEGLHVLPLPEIELNWEEQKGLFIKTGYYLPSEKKVVVFCKDRHIKDILRSFAHEMIHHAQNLEGKNLSFSSNDDVKDNKELEKLEAEAYLKGNILFRKWTEYVQHENKKDMLNENVEYEETNPEDIDLSSFNIKRSLNPKFWKNGRLDSRIRMKLLDLADDFIEYLGVDWVKPDDIIITGSIANFNWNKDYSDIDLHVVLDYSKVDERREFVANYFNSLKKNWNEEHKDIEIFGFPVEVYVQDTNETHTSSGVYSLEKDKWLETPEREVLATSKVNKEYIKNKVAKFVDRIDNLETNYIKAYDDKHKIEQIYHESIRLFDIIKAIRKKDLQTNGKEISNGNIVFKTLRRLNYIEKLLKIRTDCYNKINSLP